MASIKIVNRYGYHDVEVDGTARGFAFSAAPGKWSAWLYREGRKNLWLGSYPTRREAAAEVAIQSS